MNMESTPNMKIPSRAVTGEEKSKGQKRKCILDYSLPHVLTKGSGSSASSSNNAMGTPQISAVLQNKAASAPSKHQYEYTDFNENKRFKQSHDDCTIPMYENLQLLGDSQFVRFSEQLLGLRVQRSGSLRRIGYCVSGQKIEDLRNRLKQEELRLHDQVAVLIGTNDFIQRTDYQLMCASYTRLLKFLKKKCSKIVLITVPPIPKFEKSKKHWEVLKDFNKFILECKSDDQVEVIDLCSVFISYYNTVCKDYYEQVYFNSDRIDLIHLNEKGFKMLRSLLDLYVQETKSKREPLSLKRQLF